MVSKLWSLLLQEGIPWNYSVHPFRWGAATWEKQAGIPDGISTSWSAGSPTPTSATSKPIRNTPSVYPAASKPLLPPGPPGPGPLSIAPHRHSRYLRHPGVQWVACWSSGACGPGRGRARAGLWGGSPQDPWPARSRAWWPPPVPKAASEPVCGSPSAPLTKGRRTVNEGEEDEKGQESGGRVERRKWEGRNRSIES